MRKNIRIISLLLSLILLLSGVSILSGCEDNHGDGESECRNCGRSPVYDLGYCKTCYKGFMDYTYGD